MSYNGIGLSTARGSGTNGYVVRNLSALKLRRRDFKPTDPYDDEPKIRKPNAELVLHEQKRSIEVKCATLQAELEDEGMPDDEVERQVSQLRTKLTDLLQKATVAAALAVTRAAEREVAEKEAAEARAAQAAERAAARAEAAATAVAEAKAGKSKSAGSGRSRAPKKTLIVLQFTIQIQVEIGITFAFSSSFSGPASFSPAVFLSIPLPFDVALAVQISFRG
ncbi:RNA-splicing factor [Haplosporangium sp. Z 767]|nr:RNA-splicing factor [Haplosporangium sp. Z 767]